MTVEAKVAQILTNVTIAVTAGSDLGVVVGDNATVASRVEVRDPSTQELLGAVTVPKVRAKVVSVQPRICVIRVTDKYSQANRTYLKGLTDDPELADWKTVFVARGDLVELEKNEEPPF